MIPCCGERSSDLQGKRKRSIWPKELPTERRTRQFSVVGTPIVQSTTPDALFSWYSSGASADLKPLSPALNTEVTTII